MTRQARDIVAECLRLERLGAIRPLWEHMGEEAREDYRLRADHLMRSLGRRGVEVILTGERQPAPALADPILSRNELAGRPGLNLVVRADGGDAFSVLIEADGQQTVEATFTLPEAVILIDRVLRRDSGVQKERGLLTKLAAFGEIHRLDLARWAHG